MSFTKPLVIATALLLAPACGVGEAPAPGPADAPVDSSASLSLRAASADGDALRVELWYHRRPEQAAPRIAEIKLRHSEDLEFVSSQALAAVTAASKSLVVQPRAEGELRTVIYSGQNLETLDSGALAAFEFRRVSSGAATIALIGEGPWFAPPPADLGVTLGPPLRLGGTR